MSPVYRRFLKFAHLTHLYVTLFGLVLILFFAVTGFMLNHEDWFMDKSQERVQDQLPPLPTAILNPVDKLAVVEALRKDYGVKGALKQFKDDGDSDLEIVFQRPGEEVRVDIERENGKTTLTFSGGARLAEVMTDLHKAKTAGPVWSLLIDFTCVLLLTVSVTGMILWWSLKSRGHFGSLVILLGAAVTAAVYFLFVP